MFRCGAQHAVRLLCDTVNSTGKVPAAGNSRRANKSVHQRKKDMLRQRTIGRSKATSKATGLTIFGFRADHQQYEESSCYHWGAKLAAWRGAISSEIHDQQHARQAGVTGSLLRLTCSRA